MANSSSFLLVVLLLVITIVHTLVIFKKRLASLTSVLRAQTFGSPFSHSRAESRDSRNARSQEIQLLIPSTSSVKLVSRGTEVWFTGVRSCFGSLLLSSGLSLLTRSAASCQVKAPLAAIRRFFLPSVRGGAATARTWALATSATCTTLPTGFSGQVLGSPSPVTMVYAKSTVLNPARVAGRGKVLRRGP